MGPLDHVPAKTVDANFEYPHPLLWRPVNPELETEFGKLDGIKSATWSELCTPMLSKGRAKTTY